MKTYKGHIELEHNKGVKIKKVYLESDVKKIILRFEKTLKKAIKDNYNKKVLQEVLDYHKDLFGDFNK